MASKLKEDVETGRQDRLTAVSQLNKYGLYFEPIHPLLPNFPLSEARKNNLILNRISNLKNNQEMGLDYFCHCEGFAEKKYCVIRWFSDSDIFVKNTKENKFIMQLQTATVTIVNNPRKNNDKKVTHFSVLTFEDIEKQGWVWIAGRKGNKNRLVLNNRQGHVITPSDLGRYPLEGETVLFGEKRCFWETMKTLWK